MVHARHATWITWGVECCDRRVIDVNTWGARRKKSGVLRNVAVRVQLLEDELGNEEGKRRDVDVRGKLSHPAWVAWLCVR